MDWLVTALSSSGLGALTGVFGGIAEKWVDIKAKRLEYGYNQRMRALDLEEAALDRKHEIDMADKHVERAEVEGEIQIGKLEADAFLESQRGAGRVKLLTYIRAAITLYTLLAATVLSMLVWVRVGGLEALTEADLTYLLARIVDATLFLATTCVTWWFAARASNLKFSK